MQNDKISVLIADDDPLQLELLVALTKKLRPEWGIVAQLSESSQVTNAIEALSPSLCILDIQLNDLSGIEIVNGAQGSVPVIFVTGYPGYAVDAFDCSAIDFVMKPLRQERLEAAFKKAENQLALEARDGIRIRSEASSSIVRFLKGRDLVMSPLEMVSYFQAQHKYTRVVLKDQEGLLRMNLSAAIQHLNPDRFWRVHRSYVVNVDHVGSCIRDEMGRIVLRFKDRAERLIVSKPYEHLFSRDGFA